MSFLTSVVANLQLAITFWPWKVRFLNPCSITLPTKRCYPVSNQVKVEDIEPDIFSRNSPLHLHWRDKIDSHEPNGTGTFGHCWQIPELSLTVIHNKRLHYWLPEKPVILSHSVCCSVPSQIDHYRIALIDLYILFFYPGNLKLIKKNQTSSWSWRLMERLLKILFNILFKLFGWRLNFLYKSMDILYFYCCLFWNRISHLGYKFVTDSLEWNADKPFFF